MRKHPPNASILRSSHQSGAVPSQGSLLKIFSLVGSEEDPRYFVLGAPMRRKATGEPLRPHLTVWEIGPDTLKTLRAMVRSKGEDETARDELVKWMVNSGVR
jgi:hypothetical protein